MATPGDNVNAHDTGPALLTARVAAERLGLNEATLRRWRWAGKGPTWLKIGGCVRYEPQAIAAFLGTCQRGAPVAS